MSANLPPEPLIKIRNVVKKFHMPSGSYTALKGVDLTFFRGEFASIIGKSGSGKSTLVNMITGIDMPTSGDVEVMGTQIDRMNHSDLSVWRGKNMGIVFQFFQLLPMLSVLENVILPMDFCNMFPPSERETRARSLLDQVELGNFADLMPAELSGGQQQCAAVARALANDPPLIVADEPTGNLDSRTAEVVFDLMLALEQQGKTIIIVTHDPSLAIRTTRTILISDGELINDTVAKALPWLPHEEMLWLTHHLTPLQVPSGEPIYRENLEKPYLYLISSGSAELPSIDKFDEGSVVKRRGIGDLLTSAEQKGTDKRFIWRASIDQPLHLLALSAQAGEEWRRRFPAAEKIFANPQSERSTPEGQVDL